MESDLIQTFNNNTPCQLVQPRALCAVCGAPAIGRNFDAMTCLSCKAFFRRNAYNEHLTFTCRLSSSCEITLTTRRHCSACRLKKCFRQGMKKELIRSVSAIHNATSAALTNLSQHQSLRSITMNFSSQNDRYSLTLDDWTLLTNIRNAYERYCVEKFLESHETIPLIPPIQPYRSRIKLQRLIDLKYKYTLIIASFIKRILQFDIFHYSLENHYSYMKDNFQCLVTVNTCELMKLKVLEHLPWEYDQLVIESVLSEEILQRLGQILRTFQTILPDDSYIIKLLIIILALSSRITPLIKKEEYNSVDFDSLPKNLLRSQNYYLTLLWKYVICRVGYHDAINFLVRFIQNFLQRQRIEVDMMEIIQNRNDGGQHMLMNFDF